MKKKPLYQQYEGCLTSNDSCQFTFDRDLMVTKPDSLKLCRICLEQNNKGYVSPCKCTGSMKNVHKKCLKSWLRKVASLNNFKDIENICCQVCKIKYDFEFQLCFHWQTQKLKKALRQILECSCIYYIFVCISIIGNMTLVILLIILNYNSQSLTQFQSQTNSEYITPILVIIQSLLAAFTIFIVIAFVFRNGTRTSIKIDTIFDYYPKQTKNNTIKGY